MDQDTINRLWAPFPFGEVEAKIQVTSKDSNKGMAVFYLSSRAIQKRLDEVIGVFNWTNHFSVWQNNSQLCAISIFNEERNEWITKHDGANNTEIEPIKGGLTDSFKRAAVMWGIGRYLYQIDGVWVEVEQRGKSSYIKDSQQDKLKVAYEAAVKRIFASAANQHPPTSTAPQNTNNKQQQPVAQVPANDQKTQNNVRPMHYFKIHSIKPSGKSSQVLQLSNRDGKIISAYIKSGEPGIAVGAFLQNVKFEEKTGEYGKFTLINSYEIYGVAA